ncbi:PH domain-containing protein [Planctomonas sp. JC2975]|uniref:PH domain-containing protein n=1 Tax=Planctomonas sp. JC2975 TaxID=2729626 RepID=UPI0014733905|nr:PH domain-containing protein [Planctomonas sp. JC2975]NNC12448.1 PH domain-containing protein [Planctomonas sp. JC2975]
MPAVDPRTAKHLISDQGEVVIDEVRKHWAAQVGPVLELVAGVIVLILAGVATMIWILLVIIAVVGIVHASWRILDRKRDHFVITNMRVFRIHGILSEHIATMPLARILDISVDKPVIGRILGYGHFIFESAAQAQGLRQIRYVGKPDQRGLTIQRVIQRAGLRGHTDWWSDDVDGAQGGGAAYPPQQVPTVTVRPAEEWDDTAVYPQYDPDDTVVYPRYDPDETPTNPIDIQRP